MRVITFLLWLLFISFVAQAQTKEEKAKLKAEKELQKFEKSLVGPELQERQERDSQSTQENQRQVGCAKRLVSADVHPGCALRCGIGDAKGF
jgi:hypothetical protein